MAGKGMTHGDYETMAATMQDTDVPMEYRRTVSFDLADALCGTGDRFNPLRWLLLCDVGPVTEEQVRAWSSRLRMRIDSLNERYDAYEKATGQPARGRF